MEYIGNANMIQEETDYIDNTDMLQAEKKGTEDVTNCWIQEDEGW